MPRKLCVRAALSACTRAANFGEPAQGYSPRFCKLSAFTRVCVARSRACARVAGCVSVVSRPTRPSADHQRPGTVYSAVFMTMILRKNRPRVRRHRCFCFGGERIIAFALRPAGRVETSERGFGKWNLVRWDFVVQIEFGTFVCRGRLPVGCPRFFSCCLVITFLRFCWIEEVAGGCWICIVDGVMIICNGNLGGSNEHVVASD